MTDTYTITGPINAKFGGQYVFTWSRDPVGYTSAVSPRKRAEIAKEIGIKPTWLKVCLESHRQQQTGEPEFSTTHPMEPHEVPPSPHADVPVKVRGMFEGARREYESIDAAIRASELPADAVIEWDGTDSLASLDVDFHGAAAAAAVAPSADSLDAVRHRITPRPDYVWLTHGRGVRCLYRGFGRWSAAELAAIAWLSVRQIWPEATAEIKRETRHPGSVRTKDGARCGPVRCGEGMPDMSPLSTRLSDRAAPDEAIAGWLRDRGFEIGKRYPHERCPFSPSPQGGRDPVSIEEKGVRCYYCGSRDRGYATYHRLAGSVSTSILGGLVRGRVHWAHARHVVESRLDVSSNLAELCYRAALRCVEMDDEKIDRCFNPHQHYIRFDGYWATGAGEPMTGELSPILAELPACDGLAAKVAEFRLGVSLERHGYYPIRPLWGSRIASVHPFAMPEERWTTDVVFYPLDLRSEHRAPFRPRYVRRNERDVDAAWLLIEEAFPKIPREYLTLLIAAKGCVEAGGGRHPMIFASGCSGAAKTATVALAASICGDSISTIEYTPNPERRMQAILEAKSRSTFAVCNEVNKSGADAGKNAAQTMQYILNIEESAQAHKLYVGQVQIGSLPVFIWTDTTLPEELRNHAQIARRLTWVELPQRVEWEPTLLATGVGKPDKFRVSSEARARACDAILSDVIDRFFREPPNFDSIAAELGFKRVEDHASTADAMVRELFEAWREAGGDWQRIRDVDENRLALAWDAVRDETGNESRIVSERDLRRVLGAAGFVRFEVKRNGRHGIVIRFDGDVSAAVELEPRPSGIDRPRNAIDGGHFAGFPCLSGSPINAASVSRCED